MKIYINGKFYDKKNASISVFDHGLLYGDGVFEGIRAYKGKVFKLNEHLKRLEQSAKAITLKLPLSLKEIEFDILKTLKLNKKKDAYIRLIVTRGEGDLGLDPRKCPNASIIIIVGEITLYPKEFYTNGLDLVVVSTQRTDPNALNPCIKSLNYLNNIMAKIESNRSDAPEAIMLNRDGFVAECTGDNIFVISKKSLKTPPSSAGALEGITRNAVIEIALNKMHVDVQENLFTPYDIYNADEVFLTGTAAEVVPVTRVDGRMIGTGKPGPITKNLMAHFKKITETEGTPF